MYDPASPLLYRPSSSVQNRMAFDPRNPSLLLPELIGQIARVRRSEERHRAGPEMPAILGAGRHSRNHACARLGFAWDVLAMGVGHCAVDWRELQSAHGSGITGDLQSNPPILYQPQELYGTPPPIGHHGTLLRRLLGLLKSQQRPARIYMISGVQRRIGFSTF